MTDGVTIALALVLGAAAGASLGSFAGVVGSRGWRGALSGRSRCDVCARPLNWFELIPLVSYPLLRGRCRRCGAAIGRTALAWEVSGAALPLLVMAVIAFRN